VRRSEKKFLNELMKEVRFPQKVKVQEPCHKAYVLLLSAVDKTEISDFSLRVEQSEIVEQCVRILSALFDNALERDKGLLLESCLLLRRSLVLQMWDDIGSNRSIFELCPRLPPAMIPRFVECGLNSVDDFASHRPKELQGILRCSLTDLKNIQSYTKMIQHSKLSVEILRLQDTLLHLRIHTCTSDQILQENLNPNEKNFQSHVFHLLCFDSDSSLICYRRIHSADNSTEYQIPISRPVAIQSLWVSLTCEDMIGLDSKISPVSYSTPQPETRIRRIGEYALTSARNLERDFPNLSPQNRDEDSQTNKKQKTSPKQTTLKSPFFRNVPAPSLKKKSSTKSAEHLSGFGIFEVEQQEIPAAGRFSQFALPPSNPKTSPHTSLSIPRGQLPDRELPLSQSTQSHIEGFESSEMRLLKSKGREFEQSYSPIKFIRSRVIHPPTRSAPSTSSPVLTVPNDAAANLVERMDPQSSPFPPNPLGHSTNSVDIQDNPLGEPRARQIAHPPSAKPSVSFHQSSQSDLFDRAFL
jgi:hypothetical protein